MGTAGRQRDLRVRRRIGGATISIAVGASASAAVIALIWLIRRPDDSPDLAWSGGFAYLVALGCCGAVLAGLMITAACTRWRWPAAAVVASGLTAVVLTLIVTWFVTADPHLNPTAPDSVERRAGIGAPGVAALCLVLVAGVLGPIWANVKRIAVDRWALAPAVMIVAVASALTLVFTGSDSDLVRPTARSVSSTPVNVAALPDGAVIADFTSADGDVHVGRTGMVTMTDTGLEMRSVADGSVRWRLPVDLGSSGFARAIEDTVVVSARPADRVLGVDIPTGRVLWSVPQSQFAFGKAAPDQYTTDTVESEFALLQVAADGRTVRRIDERTGKTRWIHDVGADCSIDSVDVDRVAVALSTTCRGTSLSGRQLETDVALDSADGAELPGPSAFIGAAFGDGRLVGNDSYRTNLRILDRSGAEKRNLGVGRLDVSPDRSLGLFTPVGENRPRIVHGDGRPDIPVAGTLPDNASVAWEGSRAVVYSRSTPSRAVVVDLTTGRTVDIDAAATDAAVVDGGVVIRLGNGHIQLRKVI